MSRRAGFVRSRRMPISLAVLAGLFVIMGSVALFEIVRAALHGSARIDPTPVYLLLGIGLLRRHETWRKLAICVVVAMSVVELLGIRLVLASPNAPMTLAGLRIQDLGAGVIVIVAEIILVLTVVQLRILMRRPAREAMS